MVILPVVPEICGGWQEVSLALWQVLDMWYAGWQYKGWQYYAGQVTV